jgi:hypothetical protein
MPPRPFRTVAHVNAVRRKSPMFMRLSWETIRAAPGSRAHRIAEPTDTRTDTGVHLQKSHPGQTIAGCLYDCHFSCSGAFLACDFLRAMGLGLPR